jgi:hypothetical protein
MEHMLARRDFSEERGRGFVDRSFDREADDTRIPLCAIEGNDSDRRCFIGELCAELGRFWVGGRSRFVSTLA